VARSQHRRKDIQMHTYLLVHRHPENYMVKSWGVVFRG